MVSGLARADEGYGWDFGGTGNPGNAVGADAGDLSPGLMGTHLLG